MIDPARIYRPALRPALVTRLMHRHGLSEPQARVVAALAYLGGRHG